MGYETKLIIGKSTPFLDERGSSYFQVFATLDLCKVGNFTHLDKDKSSRCYFYMEDGDTQVTEDRYGKALYPIPIKDVLEEIKVAKRDFDGYRHYDWAIALLESMVNDKEKLEVLIYGY